MSVANIRKDTEGSARGVVWGAILAFSCSKDDILICIWRRNIQKRSSSGTNSTGTLELSWPRYSPQLCTQKNAEKLVTFSHTANRVLKIMGVTTCMWEIHCLEHDWKTCHGSSISVFYKVGACKLLWIRISDCTAKMDRRSESKEFCFRGINVL
jgi:hypothetical protein